MSRTSTNRESENPTVDAPDTAGSNGNGNTPEQSAAEKAAARRARLAELEAEQRAIEAELEAERLAAEAEARRVAMAGIKSDVDAVLAAIEAGNVADVVTGLKAALTKATAYAKDTKVSTRNSTGHTGTANPRGTYILRLSDWAKQHATRAATDGKGVTPKQSADGTNNASASHTENTWKNLIQMGKAVQVSTGPNHYMWIADEAPASEQADVPTGDEGTPTE